MSFRIISDDIPQFEKRMVDKVERGIRNATFATEAQASRNAPFKTGFLRNSIGSQSSGGHGTVYAGAEYARYQEGDPFNRHFMAKALESVAPSIVHYIESA